MMKNLLLALSLAIVALVPTRAYASHALGAQITYVYVSPNVYRVTYGFFRDCNGIAAPSDVTLQISSASCGITLPDVTLNPGCGPFGTQINNGYCTSQLAQTTCNGGNLPGVEVYNYCGLITLPQGCNDWILSVAINARNQNLQYPSNINGGGTEDLWVQAMINNVDVSDNNSAAFTSEPSRIFCAGNNYCYNHGGYDLDGDSLVFSLVNPLGSLGVPITSYNNGLSPTTPISTNGNNFTFDPVTGQMCFTPDQPQIDVVTVQVDEYRIVNGVAVKVGSTMRDIQFTIFSASTCNNSQNIPPPTAQNASGGTIITPDSIVVCPGTQINFGVTGSSTNSNAVYMSSDNATSIPGSTFTVTGAGTTTVTGNFSWLTTAADSGLHTIIVTINDSACPVSITPKTIKIYVYKKPVVYASATAACGDSVQLTATGGSTYTWTPTTGLSCTTCPNPKAYPTAPTTYTAHTNCGNASVTINIGTPFTLNAGNDTSICLNGSAQLNAVVTGGVSPFTYSWSSTGPSGIISNPTVANPVVSPSATTTFALHVVSSQGCVKNDTLKVTLAGAAPRVVATVDPDSICPGGIVQLNLSVAPQACGAAPPGSCTGTPADFTLGAGNLQVPANGSGANGAQAGQPAMYGTYYGSRKIQMIYTAAELTALGATGGQISSMAFNVASIPAAAFTTLDAFSIRMKCTSDADVSTGFRSNAGMTTVYSQRNYNVTTGWNVHTFDTPYIWDGSSNILVEICWNNQAFGSANVVTYYSVTPFNSITDYRIDFNDACPQTTPSATTYTHRPNTRFNICGATLPANSTINWTPTTGLNNPNIINPRAQVFANTTYIGNVSVNGCTGSGFVNVKVQKNLVVTGNNDTSICISDSILLHASTVGNAQPVQLNCGLNGTACGGPNSLFTVGSAATSTNTVNPFIGNDDEAHMQVLLLASELKTMGMTRGVIKDLAFNVANKASTGPFKAFTIKMGCTNTQSLTTTFETGLSTVFSQDVTTTAGWNTFTFSSPYDWDGYSNILVEVCFTNAPLANVGSDIISATPTGYNSTIDTSQSFVGQVGGGCAIAKGAVYQLRPDIRFNICPPPPGTFHYSWRLISGSVTPGTPATLTGDSVKIKPTADVSYEVQVTDSSCYAFDTVSVHFLNGYSGNLVGKNIGCNGSNTGDIIATPTLGSPPYTFTWTNSAHQVLQTTVGKITDTLSGLAPGEYFLSMTDVNLCQAKDSITLTVPSPLKVDNLIVTNVGCFGQTNGSAQSFISGGTPYNRVPAYDYEWNNVNWTTPQTGTSITGVGAGLYSLHIVDSSGCTLDTFVTITEPAPLVYDMDSTPVICYGGNTGTASINIISGGSGNFSFAWSNGQHSRVDTALAVGMYTLTVTDVPGNCLYVDSVKVTQNDSFMILISAVKAASCWNTADGQAEASVGVDTTNYTFLWDNTETTAWATHLSPGIRRVVVTNNVGCPQYAYATITAPDRFTLTTQLLDKIQCYGDSNASAMVIVDNTAGGVAPFRYLWSNQQNHDTVIQLKGGDTYGVTVTDANGCPEYDSIKVTQPDSLHLTGGSINATCYNGNDGGVFVKVTGGTPGYYYDWSNGAQTDSVHNLPQGTYSVVVSDRNNCRNSLFNIPVGQPATPVGLKSVNIVNVSCPGNNDGGIFAVAQGGTPGYTYTLNGGTSQVNGYFNPLRPDSNYVLNIADSNGCKFDTVLVVTEPDSFSVTFMPATDTIKIGDSVRLQPTISPLISATDQYTWSPSSTLSCDNCSTVIAKPLVTTVYELTLTRGDTNQCSRSARVEVVVVNDKVLYVPNAFSPNGDGFNDFFTAYAVGGKSMKMTVYDRWGEIVYAWDGDMNAMWDGTFKGVELPSASYIYFVEVTYLDKQIRAIKGSVTIVK